MTIHPNDEDAIYDSYLRGFVHGLAGRAGVEVLQTAPTDVRLFSFQGKTDRDTGYALGWAHARDMSRSGTLKSKGELLASVKTLLGI